MPVANRNPLPNGSYCIEVPTSSAPHFAAWALANRGKVAMRRGEPHGDRTRFYFDVVGPPGAFPFGRLGFPSVVGDLTDDLLHALPGGDLLTGSGLQTAALLFILYQLLK